jgi:predicted secreted protein with PEFG-CTERM motif
VIGTVPVFAQTNSTSIDIESATKISGEGITITTDKAQYYNGETVSITGEVDGYESGKTLALIVRSPIDDVIIANEVNVDSDGVFFHTFMTGGDAWNYDGDFKLFFIYDSDTTQYNIRIMESDQPVAIDRDIEEVRKEIIDRIYINIETDKTHYDKGDIITINGKVRHFHSHTPITLMIISPNESIVFIDQINVSRFKEFTTSFIADGNIKIPGEYIVDATYGTGFIGKTTFMFGQEMEEPAPVPIQVEPREVFSINGFVFDYFMSSGKMTGLIPDVENDVLDVLIDGTEEDGEMILSIPREIADGEFIVLIEDELIEFTELETTVDSRTISIPYQAGDTKISIFASYVVPEFGTVVFMIFAVAIVTVIGLTYSNKLKIP